jgi:O-antigen ligase
MNPITSSSKSIFLFVIGCVLVSILGYAYVSSFALGIRTIIVVHGLVLSFLLFALSLGDLKSFLVFGMVVVIPMAMDYNLVRDPSPPGFPVFSEGIVVSLVDCFLAILLIQWLVTASLRKKAALPTLGHPIGTLLLFWIFYSLFVALLKSDTNRYGYFEVVTLVQSFLVYFYLVNNTNSVRDLKNVVYALFAAQMIEALYMIGQAVTGMNYTLKGVFIAPIRDEVGFRSAGFTGAEVVAEQMIALVAPVVLAYYFKIKSPWRRLMAAAIILIFAAAIMCAKSRAAGVAIMVGFITVFALGNLRGWITAGRVFKWGAVVLIFLIVVSPLVYTRFQKGSGSWEEARVPLVRTALNMWEANWLLGVGPSNYNSYIDEYVPVKLRDSWKAPVHNEFMMQLAERGVIGTSIYYILMVVLVMKLWRITRYRDEWLSMVSVGILGGMIGSLSLRFFHWYHQMPSFTLSCVIMALVAAMEHMSDEPKGIDTDISGRYNSYARSDSNTMPRQFA